MFTIIVSVPIQTELYVESARCRTHGGNLLISLYRGEGFFINGMNTYNNKKLNRKQYKKRAIKALYQHLKEK